MSIFIMPSAAKILATGLLVWFAVLMALIAIRMLRGDIATSGMLTHDANDGAMAPERVLHIAAFPLVLLYYIQSALGVDVSAVEEGVRPSMPDIPGNLLALLTGTNSFYLAGKLARR